MLEHEYRGFKWELKIPSNIDNEIRAGRDWEPKVTQWIESQLQPGDVAIDIGANIGWFAMIMAKAVGPSGVVVALEPEPSFRERLLRHKIINQIENIRISHYAVGAQGGIAWCVKNAGPYHSSAVMKHVDPGSEYSSVEVAVIAIDDWLDSDRLDLMKIDVDGWEEQVLLGARQTIETFSPRIAIEIADKSTADLLVSYGYQLWWERGMRPMSPQEIHQTLSPGLPTLNIFAAK